MRCPDSFDEMGYAACLLPTELAVLEVNLVDYLADRHERGVGQVQPRDRSIRLASSSTFAASGSGTCAVNTLVSIRPS